MTEEQSPSDLEESVRSDLEHLATSWIQPQGEAAVRRDSAVLRRLLLDGSGTLRRYRQQLRLKGDPKIRAIDLMAAIPGDWSTVILAAAGGAQVGGVVIQLIETRSAPPPEPPSVTFPTKLYPLSNFLMTPCMIVAGHPVNRKEVIQYVANKLGGVHLDTSRKADEIAYKALDEHRGEFSVLNSEIDLLYYELLAIGQHLLRSDDISSLVSPELRLDTSMPGIDTVLKWKLVEEVSGSWGTPTPGT